MRLSSKDYLQEEQKDKATVNKKPGPTYIHDLWGLDRDDR